MKPKVVLDNEVFRKIMHWVNKSEYEVSGLGTVQVEADGVLRVTDAMLLPQKNGSTHTDIEAEDVNKALFLLKDAPGQLRFWWHSHVNMNVFWSGTDMDTIKKIGEGGWFACSVFNKKREIRSAYYGVHGQSTPWGVSPLFLDELDTQVEPFKEPCAEIWDAEYEKNVTNVVPKSIPQLVGSIPGLTGGNWVGRGGDTTTNVFTHPNLYDRVEPPATRPPGMKKREYKTWKRKWREAQQSMLSEDTTTQEVDSAEATEQAEYEIRELSAYGFDDDDINCLTVNGWDLDDVDEMVDEDITPREILIMAAQGVDPQEVRYMLTQSYDVRDVVRLAQGDKV
jgi:hypothetical protein